MTPEAVHEALSGGAILIDMRPPKPFATEHVRGAVNFQFNRTDLADRADMALPRRATYVVHAEPEPIARTAVEILSGAGFTVAGSLDGGLRAWKAAGLPTERLPLLDVDALHERMREFRIVDTREGFEFRYGHIAGAELLPWGEAWDRVDAVPGDRPIALVCGDQVRSAYVASLMQRAGKPAHLVFGGMADWMERGYATDKG